MKVYKFKGGKERWAGSAPDVCVGLLSEVTALIDLNELKADFGGYAIYVIDEYALEFAGVWGARKAVRFRQILQERGATLDIVEQKLPDMRLKITSVSYVRN